MIGKQEQITLPISFDRDVYEKLLETAEQSGRTLSALVNEAVRNALSGDLEDPEAFERHFSDPGLSFEQFRNELRARK